MLLFAIVKDLGRSSESGGRWNDPEFVAEMDRRVGDWEAGQNTVTSDTVDEAMNYLRTT